MRLAVTFRFNVCTSVVDLQFLLSLTPADLGLKSVWVGDVYGHSEEPATGQDQPVVSQRRSPSCSTDIRTITFPNLFLSERHSQ